MGGKLDGGDGLESTRRRGLLAFFSNLLAAPPDDKADELRTGEPGPATGEAVSSLSCVRLDFRGNIARDKDGRSE